MNADNAEVSSANPDGYRGQGDLREIYREEASPLLASKYYGLYNVLV